MRNPDPNGRVWPAVLIVGIASGVGLTFGASSVRRRWLRGGSISPQALGVIAAARRLLTPVPPLDYVGPGDARWDDYVLGGRTGDGWQWYDPTKGTTCAITVDAILEQAGVSVWTSPLTGASGKLLLNKPEPTGVGFIPGAWGTRFVEGGDACGIRTTDPDLRAGDIYYIVRDNNPAKWHVGTVLERNGDQLITADGGQTAPNGDQCARINPRTLDGRTLSSKWGAGEVQWRLTWP